MGGADMVGGVVGVAFFFRFLNLMLELLSSPKGCAILAPVTGQSGAWAKMSECSLSKLEIKMGRTTTSGSTMRITLLGFLLRMT